MLQNQNLKNIIDQHMNSLPPDVQEAIHGSSWERKILDIGRRYGLHVDQLEVLQTELSLAVLGLIGRDEFVKETIREAGISRQIMDLMVLDINREIFEPIRNHLKQTRAREETLEEVSHQNSTTSGLRSHEEEELEKHGVSFDLDKEQEIQKPEIKKEQEIYVQPILSKPLSISTNNQKVTTTSFQDILNKTNIQKVPGETTKKVDLEENSDQQKKENSIIGLEIQTENLPSAKTEEFQNTINQSKKVFYQGTDPYRESIT